MGVKLAKAMGAHVTVFTTSLWKLADAPRLGADEAVLSTDKEAMMQHMSSLDFILSTVPESHDINPYVALLKRDGTLVILGAFEPLEPGLDVDQLAFLRRSVAPFLIGSI
jgi:alcohol dehydrogenase (NADP+)